MSNEKKAIRELRAANPVAAPALALLDLAAGEAALGDAILAEAGSDGEQVLSHGGAGRSRSPLAIGAGAVALAAVVVAVLLTVGGTSDSTPAYGAELVRYAESGPLLLLEGPGWRVENVDELSDGQGTMQFLGPKSGRRHQRWVDLAWYHASLGKFLKLQFDPPIDRVPGREVTTSIPALGATVHIDTRAESAPQYGGPGDHEMVAIWGEGGRTLMLNGRVPDLAAFRERLAGLHRVDAQTWLDAMPAKVIKAVDRSVTVDEMLRGIPLPPGFDRGRISGQGLTTSRYLVGVAVGGGVACDWFRLWGEARRTGDASLAEQAENALGGAARWPVFRAMSKEGAYPATVVEYAKAMPSGRWYGRPLLHDVGRGLGCAELGFPLG